MTRIFDSFLIIPFLHSQETQIGIRPSFARIQCQGLQPGYTDAYHNLGVTLAKTGDLTGAIAAWAEAERLDPEAVSLRYSLSALVSYNYGVSLVRAGKLVQAMKEWQAALRIQPHFPEAHYALGLGFLVKQNPAVATSHFQSALSWVPDWVQAHVALGQAHYDSQQQPSGCEAGIQNQHMLKCGYTRLRLALSQ